MGAVGGAKGIIDEEIGMGGQLLSKFGVILLFFRIEADIFEEGNLAITEASHNSGSRLTNAVGGKSYGRT